MSFHKDAYEATIIMEWHNVTKVFCLIWAHVFQIFSQVSLKTFVQKRCQHHAVFTNKTTTNSFRKSRRRWGGMLGTRTTATLSLPRVCVEAVWFGENRMLVFGIGKGNFVCECAFHGKWRDFFPEGEKQKENEFIKTWNISGPQHARKKNVFIPPFAGRSATRVTGRFLLRGSFLLERMGFCGLWGFSLWRWYDWS